MTNQHPFSSEPAKASTGEVLTLALIAGVILTALVCAVAVMLEVSKTPDAAWTGFSIGTVFGVTCALSALLIAARRA